MDAIARIDRMPVQQNLSPNDRVSKPHKSRATVRAHIVHQCPTPLWKRAIVQITDWLSVVPRALGLVRKDSLEPPTTRPAKQFEKNSLLLLREIASIPIPHSRPLAEKLLLNANIVSWLILIQNDVSVLPSSWLNQLPQEVRTGLECRIRLLTARDNVQDPNATIHAKTLHAFCTRVDHALWPAPCSDRGAG
jgi:hypothetical protein